MSLVDTITAFLVLLGVFILAYSAIRHQGIGDIIRELKEAVKGKAEEIKDNNLRYN